MNTIYKMAGMTTSHWENIPQAPPRLWSGLYMQFASIHYGWSTLFTNRKISKMPLFNRGYTGTPGRTPTLNLSYAFIGLLTSNTPLIDTSSTY
jgi:hypothetical protein